MKNNESLVHVENVAKKFGLTLQQTMKYGLLDISKKLLGQKCDTSVLRNGEFWAVHHANFILNAGESLGIMGANGSGKTTLLRMLNGVYAPDSGRIIMRGRVGALIAAGAGFAPMLTGRENIFVNGALLGLTTKEIKGLLDEIIAFSDLGQFIDLPVKNYSSGMFVRLGFAIAALSKPNVLLMDEVLAVGDLNFQKKCYDYILKLKREGTAIILVSHSPSAIWSVCDRALFMDHGKILLDDSVERVVKAYEDQNSRNAVAANQQFNKVVEKQADKLKAEYGHMKGGTGDVICHFVKLMDTQTNKETSEFEFSAPISIEAEIELKAPQENILLRLTVDAMHYRYIATIDSYEQGVDFPHVTAGRYKIIITIPQPNFRPGAYAFNFSVSKKEMPAHLFYWIGAAHFVVKNPVRSFLYSDHHAVMHLESDFKLISMGIYENQ